MTVLIVVLKLIPIVSGIALIAGGIGREFTRPPARRTNDIRTVQALVAVSGRFEQLLAIPGSLVVFVAGIVLAWLEGWPLLGVLQGASVNWLLAALILYMALYPLVIWIFIPRGRHFEPILADAIVQGRVTAELTAARCYPSTVSLQTSGRMHTRRSLVVGWWIVGSMPNDGEERRPTLRRCGGAFRPLCWRWSAPPRSIQRAWTRRSTANHMRSRSTDHTWARKKKSMPAIVAGHVPSGDTRSRNHTGAGCCERRCRPRTPFPHGTGFSYCPKYSFAIH